MKKLLACFSVCAALALPAHAVSITVNEASSVRIDFTAVGLGDGNFEYLPLLFYPLDFLGFIRAFDDGSSPVQIEAFANPLASFYPVHDFFEVSPSFGAGDVSNFEGTQILTVPGGLRFVYGARLPESAVPDQGSAALMLLMTVAGVMGARRRQSAGRVR